MFLSLKLIFETYLVTPSPKIVFKTHISICLLLTDNVLLHSSEVDHEISYPSSILDVF